MNQKTFNKREIIRFSHFSRKGYALFSCLGREVLVGVLSVSTLTYAKADGISVKPELAQDSLSHEEVRLEEVVVTGSRTPLAQQQAARMVSVITHDEIERAAAQSINDVFKLATGVDVRQRGGFGVQTDISINGGTFDQIAILLNGVNISNAQTGHNAGDFPVSVEEIERIEIVEGAASRVLGSSAFSGAVNIVTRKPQQGAVGLSVAGGSFGTLEVGGRYYGVSGKVRHQASAGYTRSDGGTLHSDFGKGRAFYGGQWRSRHADIDWQGGWSLQRYGANTFYSAKYNDQYEQTGHVVLSVGGRIHGLPHGMQVRPLLYGNIFTDHYQLMRGKEGAGNGENYHRLLMYGASTDVDFRWLGGTTTLGADIRKEQILSTAYGEPLAESRQKKIGGSDRWYDHRGDRTNTSLFAEHHVVWRQWTMTLGFMANKNTGLQRRYRLYPGIDLCYRPAERWKIFASWNKGSRMPTFTDLYTSNAVQQGDVMLKPEKNATTRLGMRYRWQGMELTSGGFYQHGRDMIDWVYETETSTRYHAMNIGRLDNMGVSVEMAIDLPTLMGKPSWIRKIRLGYAYIHQHHETDQPIYKSLYALEYLKHKVTLQVDHQLWKHLSACWSLRWQERMNGYHPYCKIDGKIIWTMKNWSLFITGDNLTGHRYYDIGCVRQPGLWVMVGGNMKWHL